MNKYGWETIEFNDSKVSNSIVVSRTLWVDNKTTPKYKYFEEVYFNGVSDKRYAICIGINPAKAESELDDTNKRLIKALNGKYGGYCLFNVYPEITSECSSINKKDKENIEFINKVKQFLTNHKYKKWDIILFFGRTFYIPKLFVKLIKKWDKQRRKVYITCHNNEFIHPGSNAAIELKEFKTDYMRTTIRVEI